MNRRLWFLTGFVVCVIVGLCVAMDYATGYGTRTQWEVLRAEADEDPNTTIGSVAVTTDANTDFWHKPSTAVGLHDGSAEYSDATAIGIAACAGAAENKTFTTNIWMWRRGNGPRQLVCSIAWTTGAATVVNYPQTGATATSKYWADTAVVTDYWFTGRIETADADGNDRMAVVKIVLYGEGWIYAEVTGADGATGAEAGDVSVYMYRVAGG